MNRKGSQRPRSVCRGVSRGAGHSAGMKAAGGDGQEGKVSVRPDCQGVACTADDTGFPRARDLVGGHVRAAGLREPSDPPGGAWSPCSPARPEGGGSHLPRGLPHLSLPTRGLLSQESSHRQFLSQSFLFINIFLLSFLKNIWSEF